MKYCNGCKTSKPFEEFHKSKRDGYQSKCKACRAVLCAEWAKANPEKVKANQQEWNEKHRTRRFNMFWNAQQRAKRKGLKFTITMEDIPDIGTHCPITGEEYTKKMGKGPGRFSASLDRIIPELGYVPGNVQIISHSANRIKAETDGSKA